MTNAPLPTPAGDADDLRVDRATGDAPREGSPPPAPEERAAAALHAALSPSVPLPASLRARLIAEGEGIVAASAGQALPIRRAASPWRSRFALAATLVLAVGTVAVLSAALLQRDRELRGERVLLAEARQQIEENQTLLAAARADADSTARLLADATSDIDRLRRKIDKYETPVDPAVLAESRTKLLEVPGSIMVAWQPFELEGAPPSEGRGVAGDVVWNDDDQVGYIRFTGLPVNDPDVEQYQVWIIDERGLEQKVSGGVFNATRDGEVIVPIKPGIDVGRVQLFAVTIEAPGGTWVPNLARRVVAAPRG